MQNGVLTLVDYLNIFKALSDENRLRILLMLRRRSLCVCEMHEVLNIALSTLSAHLKLMKNTGLIVDEKDGRWVIYSLSQNTYLHELLETLEKQLRDNRTIESDRAIISQITRELCAYKLKESARKK
ncbi:MAG: helix-turn-helix transcriptional regulator [Spirochaetes bacterium]|nr:helix-turn-helix transcriptional regulator [Spirochaetota bacterium]